jgi:hypothetical protein
MIDRTLDTAKAPDLADGGISGCMPWRVVAAHEDEDDVFLDERFVDDYEYHRQQARRPDHPEKIYMDLVCG